MILNKNHFLVIKKTFIMQKITLVTYVWLDSDDSPRSKVKVLKDQIRFLRDLPVWNYDGSSTGQATGRYSDVLLKPQRMYTDPFRGKPHVIVLCDCWDEESTPNIYNSRIKLKEIIEQLNIENSKIKLEQQFVLCEPMRNIPYGWQAFNKPGYGQDNSYYCGTGGHQAFGQRIVEKHVELCLEAGVDVLAYSAETMPSMWRLELNELDPLKAFDDIIMARYLLCVLTEKHKAYPSFDPSPYNGEWKGPSLIVNLPNTIDAEMLVNQIMTPIKLEETNLSKIKLTIKGGCEIEYCLLSVAESTLKSTNEKSDMERIIKPTSIEPETCIIRRINSRINNGIDGYLLLTVLLKIKTE